MYFSCSVDDGFPTVKFYFEGSLSLTVYPHEYLFQISVSNNVSSRILFKILTCQVSFHNLVTVFFRSFCSSIFLQILKSCLHSISHQTLYHIWSCLSLILLSFKWYFIYTIINLVCKLCGLNFVILSCRYFILISLSITHYVHWMLG